MGKAGNNGYPSAIIGRWVRTFNSFDVRNKNSLIFIEDNEEQEHSNVGHMLNIDTTEQNSNIRNNHKLYDVKDSSLENVVSG